MVRYKEKKRGKRAVRNENSQLEGMEHAHEYEEAAAGSEFIKDG